MQDEDPPRPGTKTLQEHLQSSVDCQTTPSNTSSFPTCLTSLPKMTSGLVLVAKTKPVSEALVKMIEGHQVQFTYRAIIYGQVTTEIGSRITVKQPIDDISASTVCQLVVLTPNNYAGHMSTVDLVPQNNTPSSDIDSIAYHMQYIGHPIIGTLKYMQQSKSLGTYRDTYVSLIRISVKHPFTNQDILVEYAEPPKFHKLREKERKFWEKKQLERENLLKNVKNTLEVKDIPVAHLTGQQFFFGLQFSVNPNVLVPRKSTETLVKTCLDLVNTSLKKKKKEIRLLDLGTGSGCIILSCLHSLKDASGVGIDISPKALDVAMENAKSLGLSDRVQFLLGDFGDLQNVFSLSKNGKPPPTKRRKIIESTTKILPFDLVLCNPPYIPSKMASQILNKNTLTHEPSLSLIAGEDGLEAYRVIIDSLVLSKDSNQFLAENGYVLFEIGAKMKDKVVELIQCQGHGSLKVVETVVDPWEVERCLVCQFH